MNTSVRKTTRILGIGMMLALGWSAFAAEQAPTKGVEPSRQAREQMARMHEEMAGCLRSEKTFADCQTQMHQRCMAAMGQQGCPMMGAGMHGRKQQPPSTDQQ